MWPKDSEAAFSNYRFWESIGFTIAYGYSAHLCTDTKLYILIGVLAVGFSGYVIVEIYLYNKKDTSYPLELTATTQSNEKAVMGQIKSETNFAYTEQL